MLEGEIFSPCAAAALYRRSAFLEVGGFDEDFFCYMEDVDLGFRLRLRGYAAVFVPQAIVEDASENRRNDLAVYHGHRNLVWCFFKKMPATLLLILCVPHLFQTLCAFSLRLARSGECLRSLKDRCLRRFAKSSCQAQTLTSQAKNFYPGTLASPWLKWRSPR